MIISLFKEIKENQLLVKNTSKQLNEIRKVVRYEERNSTKNTKENPNLNATNEKPSDRVLSCKTGLTRSLQRYRSLVSPERNNLQR